MTVSEKTTISKKPESSHRLIVGVVASAGGLDAFKQLISAIRTDCGMAFVLVPHLDPNFESQMVAILSKVSLLPVVAVTHGMLVEANQVYVIPPNSFLTIDEGVLKLSEPPTPLGHETAIDCFLRSLAKDQGERSVGIVLSGTGSHGTLGIRAIKLAGGMAIAQQPTTAEFDTMPASIIHEGLSDYVLPPSEMPAALMEYIRHPYINHVKPFVSDATHEEGQIEAILASLLRHTGYDFGSYRKNMMLRRIQRRMVLLNFESLHQYVERLNNDPKETTALYRDLLISVTAFFRDPEAYQALSNELVAEATTRDAARLPYRVWVPGCATGEEAYSLAILLIECLEQRLPEMNQHPDSTKLIQVFASDVDEDAIAMARKGIYPLSIAHDVTQERLNRFFSKTNPSHLQIGKQLRESIVFSRQNLINDAPFSKLDMISCRNLLIYLEPEMQRKVISLFHFALSDHGVLMLGPSESISQSDQLFEPISKKWRLFRKKKSNRNNRMPIPLVAIRGSNGLNQMQSPYSPPRQGHKEIVEKALISLYAPASVLVNHAYEILYMTGPLVDYLEFPAGEPNHNLIEMCRPGLRGKLRFACQKSIEEEVDTDVETQMKRDGITIECLIKVRRIKSRLEADSLFLISFSDKSEVNLRSSLPQVNGSDVRSFSYSDQLERDLKLELPTKS